MMVKRLRRWASFLKRDMFLLWYACRDPRTPWWQKAAAVALACYGISPIDLVPDVIPLLGLMDDAVILPTGMMLLLRLLPADVKLAGQQRLAAQRASGKKLGGGCLLLVIIWLAATVWLLQR